jgi:hypothetical protein
MASDHDRGHQGQPSTSGEGTCQGHDELAQLLSELARSLYQKGTVHDTLMGIVRAAVDNVPGAQSAGDQRGGGTPPGQHSGMDW